MTHAGASWPSMQSGWRRGRTRSPSAWTSTAPSARPWPTPEAARPLPGVPELLGPLVVWFAAVALISGRPALT
jgi:hypothetical protein